MGTGAQAPLHGLDAVPRSPVIDSAPPVAPNLARAPEIRQIHRNFLETLVFKGVSTPLALALILSQRLPEHWFVLDRLFVNAGVCFRRQFGYKLNLVPASNVHLPRAIRAALRPLITKSQTRGDKNLFCLPRKTFGRSSCVTRNLRTLL